MRVLFTVSPGTTVFTSMVPLAWALRTAGHEVRVASQPLFAPEITQAGLTAVPVGRDLGIPRLLLAMGLDDATLEQSRRGLPDPYSVIEDPGSTDWVRARRAFTEVAEGARFETFAIMKGLVEFARAWEPDLVVWEPFTPAGAIVAKACGAAHARLLYGVDVFAFAREHFLRLRDRQEPADRADPLADWLGGYATKFGAQFSEDMTTGQFTLDQIPASLQTESDLHYLRTPYVPYSASAVVLPWLQRPPRRPRVALTMGLSATGYFAGYTVNVQDILDALADLDIELVATVAATEQAGLRRVPDNARIVSYVALNALAPTCTAAITHAGFGTLTAFARYGVPQLTLPFHFDEPLLGRRLAGLGAGLDLDPTLATAANVRDGLLRLLGEPGFARGAEELRAEIRALPSPNDLVPEIEALTHKHLSR